MSHDHNGNCRCPKFQAPVQPIPLPNVKPYVITTSFEVALHHAKKGALIQRQGWNGKGMFVAVQHPDEHSANTLPYLWMKTADGNRVPWLASQTDLLAEDWVILA